MREEWEKAKGGRVKRKQKPAGEPHARILRWVGGWVGVEERDRSVRGRRFKVLGLHEVLRARAENHQRKGHARHMGVG